MLRFVLVFIALCTTAHAGAPQPCARPAAGSEALEPTALRSAHGALELDLYERSAPGPGPERYCFELADGRPSPTLRVRPGDEVVLRLHNQLELTSAGADSGHASHGGSPGEDPCLSGRMSPVSTNLHFHGLTLPPRCHEDEVLRTSIQPGDAPFEYHLRIPEDEPPGLYWYHPHIHGFSTPQVLGGASGALIVEGIERADPELAGLPERVLVVRDQNLMHPDAPPSKSEPVVPKMMIDRDGDAANNGTGFGKPAKDLSLNFVPVPYPDYPPSQLHVRPEERELWRVLNASAVTYLNLALIFGRSPQALGIVGLDGVPLAAAPGVAKTQWHDHIGIPPGGRVEFLVKTPPPGTPALLVTRTVDTGQGGENDPNRPLATVIPDVQAPQAPSTLEAHPEPLPPPARPWLGSVTPTRVRHLYFSERLSDPKNPNSATTFFITVEGEEPVAFDPARTTPNITVQQGEVEDWIIENRSTELHAFHIHQIHFLLLDWSGQPVDEPFLRDTVNVPYFNGRTLQYPSVRLRMDFRDPNIVGTFVYHCHLLEHEDGGMMGLVRVLPATTAPGSGR